MSVVEVLFLLWAISSAGLMVFCLVMIFFIKLMPKDKKPIRSYTVEEDEFEEWR